MNYYTPDGYPAPPLPPVILGNTQAMAYRTPYMQPVPAPKPPRRKSLYERIFPAQAQYTEEWINSWKTGRMGPMMRGMAMGRAMGGF